MIAFSLKGLLGRKLRTALTALAIVLGVAMISGTYVLTDTISQAFDNIFTESYRGTDAVVTAKEAFQGSAENDSGFAVASLPESTLRDVLAIPDVEAAVGGVAGEASIVGKDGKAVSFGGAPNLGFSVDPSQPEFESLTLVDGAWPTSGEVVIDKATADKEDFAVGDAIGIQGAGPVERLRLSGLVRFGAVSSIGGATLAGFDLATAQRIFDKAGKLDQIRVAAKPGVSPTQLLAALDSRLPDSVQVRTGSEQASEDASGTNEFISFLQNFLLAFAGIALFVGAFVIANSLSITIAQRAREFATVRTLGGSRKQVLWSVILEAIVVGLVASVIGLFAGFALAKGLSELFDAVGFTLPKVGLVYEARTIVVALLVGVVVTLLASLRPAIRATRVPPIAAVREGAELPPARFARFRTAGAVAVVVLGFAALLYGLFRSGIGTTAVLLWMGVGAVLIFIGVGFVASRLVRPLVRILGIPAAQIGGAAGRLAQENSQRNPERTASTAAALMIGLALVTLVAVLAAGITSTFRDAVNELFTSDYAITAQNNFSPIPTSAAEAAADAPGVEAIASVRAGEGRVFGEARQVSAVDPDMAQVLTIDWKDGSQAVFAELGRDGAIVDDGFANDHELRVGSPLRVLTPAGGTVDLVIKGIFDPPTGGSPFGAVTMSSQTFDRFYENPRNLFTFVKARGGETAANTAALERSLEAFPNAKVQTREEFIDNQISGLNSVLNILYVLLALSVIVSLFGIVNTLVLTVFERTREIGMLRAIGMTRRQVRRMIRHESVITSMIGGVLGIVLGIVLGALLVARVDFIDFSLPVGQILIFAVAAIVVGILAAIFPARRAARLNVLRALQYE
ncbi:MAG TPA: FtsX-like permease family protein [Gaiellaceae bacterium]|nr:FtsX-like permease family protein [Gaiellaceae bacterium]